MHGALLVPHQDVLHLVLLEQRVIDRQHRAAGIAENVLDALIGERRDHHFRAGHLRHGLLRSLCSDRPSHGRRWNSEIKKGLEEPLIRAPPRLAGGSSTPGGAPRYENQRCNNKSPHGCCAFLDALLYTHCVSLGQADMRLRHGVEPRMPVKRCRLKSE